MFQTPFSTFRADFGRFFVGNGILGINGNRITASPAVCQKISRSGLIPGIREVLQELANGGLMTVDRTLANWTGRVCAATDFVKMGTTERL